MGIEESHPCGKKVRLEKDSGPKPSPGGEDRAEGVFE